MGLTGRERGRGRVRAAWPQAHQAAAAATRMAPAWPGAQAASAVAELFADIALCPLEAARIRLVAQPGYAPGVGGALARLAQEEGVARVLYAGFGPMLFKQVGGAGRPGWRPAPPCMHGVGPCMHRRLACVQRRGCRATAPRIALLRALPASLVGSAGCRLPAGSLRRPFAASAAGPR